MNAKFPGREASSNLLQKWLSICLNIDYENGSVQTWINGIELKSYNKSLIYPNATSMTVRLGKYYGDGGVLIGKILDFNMWDRTLGSEEMQNYTQCYPYHSEIPNVGNLINPSTSWSITGSLIKKIEIPQEDIVCQNRTVLIPKRFEKMEKAMAICEILGEEGDYLKHFESLKEYETLFNLRKTSKFYQNMH